VNLVLLPAGGVAQNPVALLIWTFLVLTLVAAVWTFLRSLLRRRTSASTTSTAPTARVPSAPAPRRRRRRSRAERAEPERLGLWTRFLIRVGAVQLTTDAFQSLSPADRARYAGDKRYDPRYHAATTDRERRAFDRDRMQRVQARLARGGVRDAEEPSAPPRRRRALPDWMDPRR
jgi:hypothetical protein